MSYPQDTKSAEQEAFLPTYQIDESQEELAVGAKKGCRGWFKRHCANRQARPPRTKAQRFKRAFKLLMVFLVVGGGFFAFFHHRHHPKILFCNDLAEDATSTDFSLPVFHKSSVLIHPSASTGNSEIIRDENVPLGQVLVTLEFAKAKEELTLSEKPEEGGDDDEDKPKTPSVVCAAVSPHGVGFGIFTRRDHFVLPNLVKTTIKVSSKVPNPALIFLGPHRRFGHGHGHGHVTNWVRKWMKKEEKEERRSVE